MFNSEGLRKFCLAIAAAAFLAVAGCSTRPTDQATNQTPAPAKKAATAKPAASKPAAGKVVAAKGTPAKPVNVSSKGVSSKGVSSKGVSSKVTQPTTFVTVPQGTTISATVGQALASNKNHAGDTFAALLSSSIKVDGKTVIPKGTHITGRVVTAQKSGPAELTAALASVDLNEQSYKLATDPLAPSAQTPPHTTTTHRDSAKAKDITVAA